jgi:hypothetical protein
LVGHVTLHRNLQSLIRCKAFHLGCPVALAAEAHVYVCKVAQVSGSFTAWAGGGFHLVVWCGVWFPSSVSDPALTPIPRDVVLDPVQAFLL